MELGKLTLDAQEVTQPIQLKVLAYREDGTEDGSPVNLDEDDIITPLGTIMQLPIDTPPNNKFLLCDGQAISRTDHAALFAIAENNPHFGTGDGSTTFNIPNIPQKAIAHYTEIAPTTDTNGDPTVTEEQIGTDENGDPIMAKFGDGTFTNTYLYYHIKVK